MSSWLSTEVGLGILRSVLLSAGGSLVAHGAISQSGLNAIVGAVIVIVGAVFSAMANHSKAQANAIVKAVEAHPAITVIPAEQTASHKPVVMVDDQPPPSLSSAGS